MNADEIKTWATVALVLWNVLLTVALWLRKPGEDAGQAVADLRTAHGREIADVRNDVTQIQTQLEHTATKEDLADLAGTVKQINERTVQMAESSRSTSATVSRIENYLLNNK